MNKTLQDFARKELKKGLAKLPDGHQHTFKRMYSPKDLKVSIDKAVDNMLDDQLDWAMSQVERSLEKLKDS